ncbi:hypothetical protein [Methylomonas sp. YC3]
MATAPSVCTNFGIFLYAYKKLAFPYLHEAQRMENAPHIFSYVLLAFIFSSILFFLVQRLLTKKMHNKAIKRMDF